MPKASPDVIEESIKTADETGKSITEFWDWVAAPKMGTKKKDKLGNISSQYFDIVKKNIYELYELREKRGSKLRINIAYLVFNENKAEEDIVEAIELFENYCAVDGGGPYYVLKVKNGNQ